MNLKKIRQRIHSLITHWRSQMSGYHPVFPVFKKEVLVKEISKFLSVSQNEIENYWTNYLSTIPDYPARYGKGWELKHLTTEEAFIIFCLLKKFSPETIVEIGPQYGMSTRRIIDINKNLNLRLPIYTFDIEDQVKYFSADEATLRIKDLTDCFKVEIIDRFPPGLIYLDAHPYQLLKNVLTEVLENGRWIVAIHDCGNGLCNPRMPIKPSESNLISTLTGVWERHILAELFNVKNPKNARLDTAIGRNYRLQIFSTIHGLAVLIPIEI